MDKFVALTVSGALIVFIAWWFFAKRAPRAVAAQVEGGRQTVTIAVDGGYTPNTVTLQKDVPATLIFDRKDPSTCLEEVVFPDFGIRQKLPLGKQHRIPIDTSKPGEYKYACGMNMFFGKVIVK